MIGSTLLVGLVLASAQPQDARSGSSPEFQLDVVYLGNPDSDRFADYGKFLEQHFQSVRTLPRDGFDPEAAGDADVVLLDWSQSDVDIMKMKEVESPLGDRDAWRTPTVLLGSAGLLIATPWQTTGSYG